MNIHMNRAIETMLKTGFFDKYVKGAEAGQKYSVTKPGFHPLSIKILHRGIAVPDNAKYSADAIFVSMSHWEESNGRVLHAPQAIFAVCPNGDSMQMVSFQNDFTGYFVEFFEFDGKLVADTDSEFDFLEHWFRSAASSSMLVAA